MVHLEDMYLLNLKPNTVEMFEESRIFKFTIVLKQSSVPPETLPSIPAYNQLSGSRGTLIPPRCCRLGELDQPQSPGAQFQPLTDA